jgi:hypothetical protein
LIEYIYTYIEGIIVEGVTSKRRKLQEKNNDNTYVRTTKDVSQINNMAYKVAVKNFYNYNDKNDIYNDNTYVSTNIERKIELNDNLDTMINRNLISIKNQTIIRYSIIFILEDLKYTDIQIAGNLIFQNLLKSTQNKNFVKNYTKNLNLNNIFNINIFSTSVTLLDIRNQTFLRTQTPSLSPTMSPTNVTISAEKLSFLQSLPSRGDMCIYMYIYIYINKFMHMFVYMHTNLCIFQCKYL